jgi:hypothetical protein
MSSNSVGGMEEYDEISGRNRTPTPEPVVVKIKPWEAAHDLRVSERSSELKASDEEIKKISKGVLKEHSVPEGRFSSFTPHALKKRCYDCHL